ncbi:MAG: hypothetical protein ACM3OC_08455 [Deltaproteobacteria bacterium]
MKWVEGKRKQCLICEREVEEIIDLSPERYRKVRERMQREKPGWTSRSGACGKCVAYYEKHE